jgi:hypothetical protein
MFKTDDNYNLYFDGALSQDHKKNLEKLIHEYQLDPKFINLLKRQYNFRIYNSYNLHKILLWVLYEALGPYAITIFFAEIEHPAGCEYQSRVDFYLDLNGNFDYELKNSLFLYAEHDSSDECKERIDQKLIGFDKDCRVRGNISASDLETFVKSLSAEDMQR